MSRGKELAREPSEKAKEFLMNPEKYMSELQKENRKLKAEIERKDEALEQCLDIFNNIGSKGKIVLIIKQALSEEE